VREGYRHRLPRGFALLGVAMTLVGCGNATSVRYAMTVEINDSGEVRRAQGVFEDYWEDPILNGFGGVGLTHRNRGGALVIPIRGRYLVVSKAGWHNDRAPNPAVGCTGPDSDLAATRRCSTWEDWSPFRPAMFRQGVGYGDRSSPQTVRELAHAMSRKDVVVPVDQLPVLLTFDGEPGMDSIRPLDARRLNEAFGAGVSLRRVTIRRTSAPVSREIERDLPFVGGLGGLQTCHQIEALHQCVWPHILRDY